MIVDVHTHTPTHRDVVPSGEEVVNAVWRPDRPVRATCTWSDYMAAMAPVDRAIVFSIAYGPGQQASTALGSGRPEGNVNDRTAELVHAHPDKLIGFLSVDPQVPGALDEIDRSVHDLKLRGIKLGPNYQNFDPLCPPALAVYARAQALGLPVLFHQGTSPIRTAPLRFAHPLVMDEIAMAYPELRVVMAHLGHPWQADTIVVIRKHPHVYADVSALFYRPWSYYHAMRLAAEWNVLHKLLLGSDFPITTPQETIDGLRKVNEIPRVTGLPRVPEDAMEAIIHRNSLELLGLEGTHAH